MTNKPKYPKERPLIIQCPICDMDHEPTTHKICPKCCSWLASQRYKGIRTYVRSCGKCRNKFESSGNSLCSKCSSYKKQYRHRPSVIEQRAQLEIDRTPLFKFVERIRRQAGYIYTLTDMNDLMNYYEMIGFNINYNFGDKVGMSEQLKMFWDELQRWYDKNKE